MKLTDSNSQTISLEQIDTAVSKMILSASGWRTVFSKSGNEQDAGCEISSEHSAVCRIIAYTFANWLSKGKSKKQVVAVATDTRPTGKAIASAMIPMLEAQKVSVQYVGVASAPEIMAYARNTDGFIYISASHNPIGHNGIKFGLNDGGVIDGEKSRELIALFRENCSSQKILDELCGNLQPEVSIGHDKQAKNKCRQSYMEFSKQVICATQDESIQKEIFDTVKKQVALDSLGVCCDLNGSARTLSIDGEIFSQNSIPYFTINGEAGKIAHEIIPEPENLVYVADFMEQLQSKGEKRAKLGFMPDCDGDRGNIVYWDGKSSQILKAQEVFALSVLAELSYMDYLSQKYPQFKSDKIAISVNDPTSMRIEKIAGCFGAKVFRAEVGEANVVNLARKLRSEGYQVRILGEGSNGGTITNPSCVRDPINTVFALLKLLCIKDEVLPDGSAIQGLFHRWCTLSGQEKKYHEAFSLQDVVDSLPVFTTTGVSESRAILHVKTEDHAKLKAEYQKLFLEAWQKDKDSFFAGKNITGWKACCNNGITQTENLADFSVSGRGGLKIIFQDSNGQDVAFIWMRGSGTEPVFRVMCDVKGNDSEFEKALLRWHTSLLEKSDVNC